MATKNWSAFDKFDYRTVKDGGGRCWSGFTSDSRKELIGRSPDCLMSRGQNQEHTGGVPSTGKARLDAPSGSPAILIVVVPSSALFQMASAVTEADIPRRKRSDASPRRGRRQYAPANL